MVGTTNNNNYFNGYSNFYHTGFCYRSIYLYNFLNKVKSSNTPKINFLGKILFWNFTLVIVFLYFFISIFEYKLSKSEKEKLLLPNQLIETRTFENGYFLQDGKKNASATPYQIPTIKYFHNQNGFRVNKQNLKSKNKLHKSIITFGDSTSYGLNINNEFTFSQIIKTSLNLETVHNSSFPGVDIQGINAKLECLKSINIKEQNKPKLLIVALFFNDFKPYSVVKYEIDSNLCKRDGLKALNLNNMPISNISIPNKINRKYNIFDWLLINSINFHRKFYPQMMFIVDSFIYKNFPTHTKIFKYFHPNDFLKISKTKNNFNEVVDIDNFNWHIIKMKNSLAELSKKIDSIVIIHIPRDEFEILTDSGIIKNDLKGLSSIFFNKVCNSNKENNIKCINGADVIVNSLSKEDLQKFKITKRLSSDFYSYLASYDLGHPSYFVSKLYAEEILRNIYN